MEPGSFQQCPVPGQEAMSTQTQEVPLNIRKHFLTVRVTAHRFPREAAEFLSLEIFKNHLDVVLDDVFWVRGDWTR